MFAITLTEKGGDQRRIDFDKPEITIGRVQGNDVVLPKGNVSKRHARVVLKDGKFIIVDLKSTNGTYVNGRKITSPLVVKGSDKIYIGDFILGVEENAHERITANPNSAPVPAQESLASAPPVAPQPSRAAPVAPQPVAPQPVVPQPMARDVAPSPEPVAAQASGRASVPTPMAPTPMAPTPMAPTPMISPSMVEPSPVAPPQTAPPQTAPPQTAPPQTAPPQTAPRETRPRETPVPAASVPAERKRPQFTPVPEIVIPPLGDDLRLRLKLQDAILAQLVPNLCLDDLPLERLGEEELWQRAESAIADLVETMAANGELGESVEQDTLIKETLNEALGLGPLELLTSDDEVTEIHVDGADRIVVVRGGVRQGIDAGFSSDAVIQRVLRRLLAPIKETVSEDNPLLDVRLTSGLRLTAVLPPVASRGTCLTIRKVPASASALSGLCAGGMLNDAMASFLQTCIVARRNILVCGAPSSGKNALLTALGSECPPSERMICVTRDGRVTLDREHWIALEAAKAGLSMETVLRGALQMIPDRIVVADVQGSEALLLLETMQSTCDGALASLAGDGAVDALSRMVSLAALTPGMSEDGLRGLVASATDVVVHVARYADGVSRVVSIDEVLSATSSGFDVQGLFRFAPASKAFRALGAIPVFYSELEERGLAADLSVFQG